MDDKSTVGWLPTEEDRKEIILHSMEALEEDASELALRTREMHGALWRLFKTPKTETA